MAVTASTREVSKGRVRYYGGGAEDDNEVILDIDVEGLDHFIVGSAAGAVDLVGSLDGTNFLTGILALEHLQATAPAVRVVVTTANGLYLLKGAYKRLRVIQNGTTDVTGLQFVGWREGTR